MAVNTEKSQKHLRGFAIFSTVVAVIGLVFLICGFFKLEFIEDIALDIWNELAASNPQLGIKVSMGPNAWNVYYGITCIFSLIWVVLAIIFFKLAGTTPKQETAEVMVATPAAKKAAGSQQTTVTRQLYAPQSEAEETPADKKLKAKKAKLEAKAAAKAKKLKKSAVESAESAASAVKAVKKTKDDVKETIDDLLKSILNK